MVSNMLFLAFRSLLNTFYHLYFEFDACNVKFLRLMRYTYAREKTCVGRGAGGYVPERLGAL